MDKKNFNFLFVGVGGQGILTASDIAASVGLEAGYDAKKSEVHGFSQRGGVVESHVRWGDEVAAPLAEKGTVDYLIATETLEAARWIEWLRPGGAVLINQQHIPPMSVTVGDAVYPPGEDILATVHARTDDVTKVAGLATAERLGNSRLANTVLLGALSTRLDVEPETWLTVIEQRVPPRYVELNREAFWEGRRAAGRDARFDCPS
ncbi:MAG: indolepyruvate oxidoreductase subunit beta [Chloroflexota bacterium]|nr:indolepyruvate oxidoreductase subunit beta [Chloroflexota bacterium]